MEDDAAVIYAYMEERGGAMPFWDKSHPEDIKERFNMSKAAFKRALGKLMKKKKRFTKKKVGLTLEIVNEKELFFL